MFDALLARLARALADAGIPYIVVGGQAVLVYGEPRLTRDIDVTIALTPDQVEQVLRILPDVGLTPLVEPVSFTQEAWVLPCADVLSELRVDFIFSSTTVELSAMERAHTVAIGGEQVRFASPEDLVVFKLIAGRPRDLEDVRTILLKQPDLDREHVRRWLREFDADLGMGTDISSRFGTLDS